VKACLGGKKVPAAAEQFSRYPRHRSYAGCSPKLDFLDGLKAIAVRAKLDPDDFWLHKFRPRSQRDVSERESICALFSSGLVTLHGIDHAATEGFDKQMIVERRIHSTTG